MSPILHDLCGGERTARTRRTCVSAFVPSLRTATLTGVAISALLSFSVSLPARAAADLSKLSPDLAKKIAVAPNGKWSSFSVSGKKSGVSAEKPETFRILIRTSRPLNYGQRVRYQSKVAQLGRTFQSINTAVAVATPEQLAALANDPTVLSISPDRPVRFSAALDVNPRSVGADVAGQSQYDPTRSAPTGAGVGVAVIDSGVAPVADLAWRVVAFKDLVNNQTAPYDDHGHGTHVAGIIAGSGASSSGLNAARTYKGIAPFANIIAVKALDAQGHGSVSNVIAAFDWVIAHKAQYNVRVINISLGGGVYESYKTDPLCQAAERAVASGIVVVASVGNWGGGYGGVGSPANDPNVIAVGASNTRGTVSRNDDMITSYTSRGPTRYDLNIKPDIIAPGNRIVSLRAPGSTLDTLYPETRVATSEYDSSKTETAYTCLSGTSMASPAVAAAAALVIQANGNLTPNGVKAALMYSAQLLTGYDPVLQTTGVYDPLTQGAGELNVPGAVEMATIMSPQVGLLRSPSLTTFIGDSQISWAGATIPTLLGRPGSVYANNLVWAGTGDDSATIGEVWGSNLVWAGTGDDSATSPNTPWTDGVVWGGNLVWAGTGDTLVSANNLVWAGTGDDSAGVPPTYPMVWGQNLVWAGTGDDSATQPALNPNGTVTGQNLVWAGTGDDYAQMLVSANNLVWAGTGDDSAEAVTSNNLVWAGTGDDNAAAPPIPGDPDTGVAP